MRVGEIGFREVDAYLLDYDHFVNVSSTTLVKRIHLVFYVNDGVNYASGKAHERPQASNKITSFRQFIPHDLNTSDHGTSSFSITAVHRIGVLDIRIFNIDNHARNLLVRKLVGGTSRFRA